MKKNLTFILILLLAAVSCFGLSGCNAKTREEPKVRSGSGETKLNFINTVHDLGGRYYTVASTTNKLILIGNGSADYINYNIVVSARSNDLEIVLKNFKFEAPTWKSAIDASLVSAQHVVTISADGTSMIKGGSGMTGENGVSHNYESGVDNPKSGGDGKDGASGCMGVEGNNIKLKVDSSSGLTIEGGDGGAGGNGGHGDGGSSPGIGQSGHGGNGGYGGNGASAVRAVNNLTIENDGYIVLTGGTGGNGGDGGHGGENTDTLPTDRADHGGNGGNGGNGGAGGYGFEICLDGELSLSGNAITVKGGAGGNGGNGNDGGSSCKNTFQTSNGGNPGAAGSGGNGGNGGYAVFNADASEMNVTGGDGGAGGKKGMPGVSPVLGNGTAGTDGQGGSNG